MSYGNKMEVCQGVLAKDYSTQFSFSSYNNLEVSAWSHLCKHSLRTSFNEPYQLIILPTNQIGWVSFRPTRKQSCDPNHTPTEHASVHKCTRTHARMHAHAHTHTHADRQTDRQEREWWLYWVTPVLTWHPISSRLTSCASQLSTVSGGAFIASTVFSAKSGMLRRSP